MSRSLAALPMVLALAACNSGLELPAQTWITPLDGQTAVALDTPLRVHMGDARIPKDYEVPQMIRVMDLDGEGFLTGQVEVVDDVLQFSPQGGWAQDHHYAWIFDPVDDAPHGPEFEFPDATTGAMPDFKTTEAIEVLGAGLDDLDRPCLVFSRRLQVTDNGEITVTVNGIHLEDTWSEALPEEQWSAFPESFDVDVTCINTSTPLSEGAIMRVWLGEAGPWRAELGAEDIQDTIVRLAWGNY